MEFKRTFHLKKEKENFQDGPLKTVKWKTSRLWSFTSTGLILGKKEGPGRRKIILKHFLTWYHQIACCSSAWIHYLPEKSEVRASVAESFYKKSIPNFYQNASWNTFLEYILLFCLLSENGFNDERVIELKPKEKKRGRGGKITSKYQVVSKKQILNSS